MELMYYPAIEDHYSGLIWGVALSIYNAENPEREEGIFEEWIFDDEYEAKERFDEKDDEDELREHFKDEDDEYFDTIGVLLFIREYSEDGRFEVTGDDYFEATVVKDSEYSRF